MWLGQVISFIGSGLTSFALGVWVLQKTGEITQYALISMFFVLPGVLLGPLAGTLIDRWDRRKAMLISDLGAGTQHPVDRRGVSAGRAACLVHLPGCVH